MKQLSLLLVGLSLILLACNQTLSEANTAIDEFFDEADALGNFETNIDISLTEKLGVKSLHSLVDGSDFLVWQFQGRTPNKKGFAGIITFDDTDGSENLQNINDQQSNSRYRFKGSRANFRNRDLAAGYAFEATSSAGLSSLHLVMALSSGDVFGESSTESVTTQMIEALCLNFNYRADYLDDRKRSVLYLKGIPINESEKETLANGLASTETAQLKAYGDHSGIAEGCFTGELVSGPIGQVFKGQTESLTLYIDDIIIGVKAKVVLELFSHSDEQRN